MTEIDWTTLEMVRGGAGVMRSQLANHSVGTASYKLDATHLPPFPFFISSLCLSLLLTLLWHEKRNH